MIRTGIPTISCWFCGSTTVYALLTDLCLWISHYISLCGTFEKPHLLSPTVQATHIADDQECDDLILRTAALIVALYVYRRRSTGQIGGVNDARHAGTRFSLSATIRENRDPELSSHGNQPPLVTSRDTALTRGQTLIRCYLETRSQRLVERMIKTQKQKRRRDRDIGSQAFSLNSLVYDYLR